MATDRNVYGRFHGRGGHFSSFDAKWAGFLPFLDFRPKVCIDFAQKLVPPYFGHGEFKNQGFVAEQNGGGAICGPEQGQFLGNLLLVVWHTYRVFTVLGPVLKRILIVANFNDATNYA